MKTREAKIDWPDQTKRVILILLMLLVVPIVLLLSGSFALASLWEYECYKNSECTVPHYRQSDAEKYDS